RHRHDVGDLRASQDRASGLHLRQHDLPRHGLSGWGLPPDRGPASVRAVDRAVHPALLGHAGLSRAPRAPRVARRGRAAGSRPAGDGARPPRGGRLRPEAQRAAGVPRVSPVLRLAANDVRLTARDRAAFFWLLILPIFLIWIFARVGGGGGANDVSLSVIDR